jgi:hypothetical protein
MEMWELVARESIRDLVARYNANGDSGRFEQVLACFASDAVMEIDGQIYRGHPEIRSVFVNAAEAVQRWPEPVTIRHHTSTLQIDLLGPDKARPAVTTRSSPQAALITGVGISMTTG